MTQHVLSLSYGKDSLACLGAIEKLGWPLDRIVHAEVWALLLKWDKDSPVSFKPDGRTVHDFDRRFLYEDLGLVPDDRKFRWKMLDAIGTDWLSAVLTHDS